MKSPKTVCGYGAPFRWATGEFAAHGGARRCPLTTGNRARLLIALHSVISPLPISSKDSTALLLPSRILVPPFCRGRDPGDLN